MYRMPDDPPPIKPDDKRVAKPKPVKPKPKG